MSPLSDASPLDPRDLLRDSLPIAVILALWAIPASLPIRGAGDAFRVAGIAMAGLYVVVRGVRLGRRLPAAPEPETLLGHLRENGWILAVAAVWFLAAQVAGFGAVQLFDDPDYYLLVSHHGYVLNTTGVGTVLLYAIAVGHARLWTDSEGGGTPVGTTDPGPAPADS